MRIFETAKFAKQRKKLRSDEERKALRRTVRQVIRDPKKGKKLKGELADLRSVRYTVQGQQRRFVYKEDEVTLYLVSFGPREGVYRG